MIVSIHQPNYMPWLGYFHKIAKCDAFIFLDDVQFTKGGYQDRVKINTTNGDNWLSQKRKKQPFGTKTMHIQLNQCWKSTNLKMIEVSYSNTRYFEDVFELISGCILGDDECSLAKINIKLIKTICRYLHLECDFHISSEIAPMGSATDRLVELVKTVGGTEYLSGNGAKNYIDEALFFENDVLLTYSKFVEKERKSLTPGDFKSGLSIIDALMFYGKDTIKFIECEL